MNRFFMIIPVLFAVVFSADANGFEIEVTYSERSPWLYTPRTHTDIAAGSGSDSDWETWKNNKMASGLYENIRIDKSNKKAEVSMGNGYYATTSGCRGGKDRACGFYSSCLERKSEEQCESEYADVLPYCGYNVCSIVPSTDPYDDGDFFRPETACEYTITETGLTFAPLAGLSSSRQMELLLCSLGVKANECLSPEDREAIENGWNTSYKSYYNMSYQQYQDSLYRKVYKPCDTARNEAQITSGGSCNISNAFVYEAGCKAEAAKKGQSPADVCYRGSHPTCPYVYCDVDEGYVWKDGKCVVGQKKIKGSCPSPLKKSKDRCCCVE